MPGQRHEVKSHWGAMSHWRARIAGVLVVGLLLLSVGCEEEIDVTTDEGLRKALTEGKKLDEATIRAELEGNICRCTGYHNIVKSIQDGASKM